MYINEKTLAAGMHPDSYTGIAPSIYSEGNNTLSGTAGRYNTTQQYLEIGTGGNNTAGVLPIESASGKLTISANIRQSNWQAILVLRGAGDGEISGQILPSGNKQFAIFKEGAGTWTLSNQNYCGGFYGGNTQNENRNLWGDFVDVQVDDGALKITHPNALGTQDSSTVSFISGDKFGTRTGVLQLDGGAALTFTTNNLTLGGRADATYAHIANVAGDNTISGNIRLRADSNTWKYTSVQANAGSLAIPGTVTNVSTDPGFTQNAVFNIGGAANGNISGVIGGTTATTKKIDVVKTGVGTWTLSGANTYTGNTSVNGGTLKIGVLSNIATSPVVAANSTGVLDVTDFNAGGGWTISSGQTLTGTGTVNGIVNDIAGGAIINPGAVGRRGHTGFRQ